MEIQNQTPKGLGQPLPLQQWYAALKDAFSVCFRKIDPNPITLADGGFSVVDVKPHENDRPLLQVRRVVVSGDFCDEGGPRIETASNLEQWGEGENDALLFHVAADECVGCAQIQIDTRQFLVYRNGMTLVMLGTWGEPLEFEGFQPDAADKVGIFWLQCAGKYLVELKEEMSAEDPISARIHEYLAAGENVARWEEVGF